MDSVTEEILTYPLYRAVLLAFACIGTIFTAATGKPIYFVILFVLMTMFAFWLVLSVNNRFDVYTKLVFQYFEGDHRPNCAKAHAQGDGGPGDVACTCGLAKLLARIKIKD